MKHVYLIGGPMGVSKTTTCQLLKTNLNHSVYLDGDWCWDMNPFVVTAETKQMVMDNICFLLNSYIKCSVYEHIIFSWVMQAQGIIDEIISHLNTENCQIHPISLVCKPQVLEERLRKDVDKGIRTEDIITKSLSYLPLYQILDTKRIDVSIMMPKEIVAHVIECD